MASTVPAPEELLDEPLHGEQHLLGVGGAGAGVHPGGVGRMGEGQRVPQGPLLCDKYILLRLFSSRIQLVGRI